jgi:hypothetical protein
VEHTPADGLVGQVPKPPFDQIEPRGGGGGEVQVKPWVFGQPFLDVGMLVGAVVIADHVDLQSLGYLAVDNTQEF